MTTEIIQIAAFWSFLVLFFLMLLFGMIVIMGGDIGGGLLMFGLAFVCAGIGSFLHRGTKKGIFFCLIAVVLMAFGVVTTTNEVGVLTGEGKLQALARIDPIIDAIMAGINANDYKKYSASFTSDAKGNISKDSFSVIVQTFGTYTSRNEPSIMQRGDRFLVHYGEVEFKKAASRLDMVVQDTNDTLTVVELYFTPR